MNCPLKTDAELGGAILPAWGHQSPLQKVVVWIVTGGWFWNWRN